MFFTDGNCEDCHYSCLTCTGPSATECQTCDYDRFLDQDQSCQEECAAGYYPNYVANMCQKCHSSCHTCVQGGAEDCMDCTSGMKEDVLVKGTRCLGSGELVYTMVHAFNNKWIQMLFTDLLSGSNATCPFKYTSLSLHNQQLPSISIITGSGQSTRKLATENSAE